MGYYNGDQDDEQSSLSVIKYRGGLYNLFSLMSISSDEYYDDDECCMMFTIKNAQGKVIYESPNIDQRDGEIENICEALEQEGVTVTKI